MKVLELKDLNREEGYIYYRRNFKANAIFQIPGNTLESPVQFCIETNPFGVKSIEIQFDKSLNYPFLPAKKALTEFILTEDKAGNLP